MANLKELRKLCGMTQKELAEKSGINIRQIQKYESGEYALNNMTAKTANAISGALGCSIEDLMSIDVSIFTSEMTSALKDGNLSVSNAVAMSKYNKIACLSKIGNFGDTFRHNYDLIPDKLIKKMSAEELAELIDIFYKCYQNGKAAGWKEHEDFVS